MSQLITQMLMYMGATFVLGLSLGWLVWRFGQAPQLTVVMPAEQEELMRERDDLVASLDAARSNAFEERTEMEALRDENADLRSRLSGAPQRVVTAILPDEDVSPLQPEALSGPRGGRPDDLTKISGVGTKVEKLLNSIGVYHFDQIADWTLSEVSWVEENLEDFSGRITRDDWQPQARILASL
jgi:predicted flap endonuclease-1-like 5' DNA nuclease